MNNFDRINLELQREAERLAPLVGMDPARLHEVILEIVDAEDQHRISRTNIRQQVKSIVLNAAHGSSVREETDDAAP